MIRSTELFGFTYLKTHQDTCHQRHIFSSSALKRLSDGLCSCPEPLYRN